MMMGQILQKQILMKINHFTEFCLTISIFGKEKIPFHLFARTIYEKYKRGK